LNICLCDDNKEDLLHLTQIIEEFKNFHLPEYDLKYTIFTNGIDLLTEIGKGKYFDIFLLDVIMSGMDDVELAKEIRNKNAISKIILLTTSREYAVESYGVNAFYYTLKPIEKVKLISLLERACVDIFDKREKYIIVKYQTSLRKIYLHLIQFVEVIGRNIFFKLNSGEIIKSPKQGVDFQSSPNTSGDQLLEVASWIFRSVKIHGVLGLCGSILENSR
jgi:DNA-binding LytR/AlgR family response regulator